MIEAVLVLVGMGLYFLYLVYSVHKCGDDPCDPALDPVLKMLKTTLVVLTATSAIAWAVKLIEWLTG